MKITLARKDVLTIVNMLERISSPIAQKMVKRLEKRLEGGYWYVCPGCGKRYWYEYGIGRKRKTCSNACRMAVSRRKRNARTEQHNSLENNGE